VDTLIFLRAKADRLSTLLPKSGIIAVLRHIEIGEKHFDRARKDGDADLFADVIYRTNHAFEGILRESYTILAGQDPKNKSAYEIESYLSQNNIFHDRVMELFTNYRTKWRNPSTHDHLAAFSEAEAFLALLSVTSFVGMLMDQMIERLSFEQEQERLASRSAKLREELAKHASEPFVDRITFALQSFASQDIASRVKSEVELGAKLRAFLTTVLPNIQSQQEPVFHDSLGSIRPDFIITEGNDIAVIELERYKLWNPKIQRAAMDQVRRYMDTVGARLGIVLVAPTPDAEVTDEKYDKTLAIPLEDGRYLVMIRALPNKVHKRESA
jgi:hypothetical protein